MTDPTVAEKTEPKAARVSGDRVTVLRINPVDGLEHYLKMVEGMPRRGRLKCNNGRLKLVSPGLRHESSDFRLGIMLNSVFAVLGISTRSCLSTLYRQRQEGVVDRGIEPDLSYYIQNFEQVRNLRKIDLSVSPPPDLVIEVVDTHGAKTALSVCRELRVPEVWVYEVRSEKLTIWTLVQEKADTFKYVRSDQSLVLPFLSLDDIAPWAAFTDEDDKDFDRRVRAPGPRLYSFRDTSPPGGGLKMATVRRAGADRLKLIPINPVDGLEYYLKMVEGLPRRGRLKCDGRSVLLVSPGVSHESVSDRFDTLLKELFDVLELSSRSMASTLYRLPVPDDNKAFEPDRSYYLQSVEAVLGLTEVVDLSVCLPPDLVIEVVDRNPALRSVGICLRLRVPEVWVYKVRKRLLVFKGFTEEPGQPARYESLERSRVLPFLTPADVLPWLEPTREYDHQFKRRARAWAETELRPRYRAGGVGE